MSDAGGEGGRPRTIRVGALARVEGEGALHVEIADGVVEAVRLEIYEPPRFFEAFLRGRSFAEVPDITARICGICPVAYQMSSVHALEEALGVSVPEPIRRLRRLLYCGEWIQSHVLHIALLHAPDFLGYPDAIRMAADHRAQVELALALKKVGNEIMEVLGGRAVHPINVKVGGFYRLPTPSELRALEGPLERAAGQARALLEWVAGLDFPAGERDYELVAVRHPDEYPMNEGRVASSVAGEVDVADYEASYEEVHVERSNALQARAVGRGAYLTGPLARYGLSFDRLLPEVQEAARAAGLGPVVKNPFRSIVVRAVETLQAVLEARALVQAGPGSGPASVEVRSRAGRGQAATEAPRGLLYHRYEVDADGAIVSAKIVPPTSQNQPSVEEDLKAVVSAHLDLDDAALTHLCEQTVRNYDPCISCATHFLKLHIRRR